MSGSRARLIYGFVRWDAPRRITKLLAARERETASGHCNWSRLPYLADLLRPFGFEYLAEGCSRAVYVNRRLGMVIKVGDAEGNRRELDTYATMLEEGYAEHLPRMFWHSPLGEYLVQEYVPDTIVTRREKPDYGREDVDDFRVAANYFTDLGLKDMHTSNVGFLRGQPVVLDLEAGAFRHSPLARTEETAA